MIDGVESFPSTCETDEDDPGYDDSLFSFNFLNFNLWTNRRGAAANLLGDTVLQGFKVFDNLEAGIEITKVADHAKESQISGGLFVGQTSMNDEETLAEGGGVVTPKTDNFKMKGSSFYQFKEATFPAIKTCSECTSGEDGGAV